MGKYWLPLRLLMIAILCWLWPATVVAENAKQVLVISNANDGPFAQVITGFKKQLSEHLTVTYRALGAAQIKADTSLLSTEINSHKPDLIFTVGADAMEMAKQQKQSIPIVATLILKDHPFVSGITGVVLTYPFTTQIQWLRKFFPHRSKVAVLFNPDENNKTIQKLKKVTEQNGLELIAIPVESPRQLPEALEELARNAEMLFAIPDDVAMSPKTAKEVLLASFRNRLPFVGLSDNWVKSGAFYALSWDYDDLGKQCALQSQKILTGQSILEVMPEAPRKLAYAINTKIAEHMNIEIQADLLKNAKTLFE